MFPQEHCYFLVTFRFKFLCRVEIFPSISDTLKQTCRESNDQIANVNVGPTDVKAATDMPAKSAIQYKTNNGYRDSGSRLDKNDIEPKEWKDSATVSGFSIRTYLLTLGFCFVLYHLRLR